MKRQLILLIITLVPTIMLAQGVGGEIKRNVNQSENKKVATKQQTTKPVTKQVIKQATLTVECPTKGAEIYINGSFKGKAPWSGKLSPGNYSVEARLANYYNRKEIVKLVSNDSLTISLSALSPLTGKLYIQCETKNAGVWIDGNYTSYPINKTIEIAVGHHTVALRASGFEPYFQDVDIVDGKTFTIPNVSLRPIRQKLEAQPYVEPEPEPLLMSNMQNSFSNKAKESFRVNGVEFNMVRVEGGTFQMGSNESDAYNFEKPVHQVTLSTYYMGETEVTQALWQAVMGSNPSYFKGNQKPVETVSWEDCQMFISKLNSLTGRKFRLPTEAEWEFAARGGVKSRGYQYSGSNNVNDVAWYTKNTKNEGTHDVKTKLANELGFYDMSGNVCEWCQDWKGRFSPSSQTNPTDSSVDLSVFRGGSYSSVAWHCRVKSGYNCTQDSFSPDLGLRLAL